MSRVSGAAVAASRRSSRLLRAALVAARCPGEVAGRLGTADTPDAFAADIEAAIAAMRALAPSADRPAVSPAAESRSPAMALKADQVLDVLLSSAEGLTAEIERAPAAVDRALLAAGAGALLAAAAELSVRRAYRDRPEAVAFRGRAGAAIDALAELLGALASTVHGSFASAALRALTSLRARLVADINETIGRLPAVNIVALDRETDAWALANHLYGDDAGRIESGYAELVARNRPRHPAALPAGPVEALS